MVYELYDRSGDMVNCITASNEEIVKDLCDEKGWTYKAIREDESFIISSQPKFETLTDAKIIAIGERQEFIEDCIAEMAAKIYKE